MMLHEYQSLYNKQPASSSGLEVFCKLEGLDPMVVRSQSKKEKKQLNQRKSQSTHFSLFDKLEHVRLFNLLYR